MVSAAAAPTSSSSPEMMSQQSVGRRGGDSLRRGLATAVAAVAVASAIIPIAPVNAFYLPGVAPINYSRNDSVKLYVNAVASEYSKSILPFDYYFEKFHFCRPDVIEAQRESLGAIIFGDRLYNSPYKLYVGVNSTCNKLCTQDIPADHAKFINERINEEYSLNWLVDGLPAAHRASQDGTEVYSIGFRLGAPNLDKASLPYFYNHHDITIEYHTTGKADDPKYRIVGVLVSPKSVAIDKTTSDCHYQMQDHSLTLNEKNNMPVTFTYNVYWVYSASSWGTRWDKYLHVTDPQIHWFSIINSIVIVLMLSGMIAMILLRALHKDISRYNSFVEDDGSNEDFGWKLVHADVFRPPPQRMLLSVLIGNGAQLFAMSSVTLVLAVLGFLSPSSRGALSTMALLFYVSFAGAAGYASARIYKMLQGEYWRQNVFLTATLIPAVIFIIFLLLNFFLVGANSSAAVPFGTMIAIIALWFLISAPLCIIGAYFGFKHPTIENPVKTNQIPRQVPTQPLYLNTWISALIGGILPFGAIFIELYFIMNSIWFHRMYYVFGFLLLVFVILVVTCAEVAVLLCYFHLCSEDWRWSWRAFLTSGASGFYVFIYSGIYYYRRLKIDNFPSTILYFGWSLVFSMFFTILTGSVGYTACLLFVRSIFSSIKVD